MSEQPPFGQSEPTSDAGGTSGSYPTPGSYPPPTPPTYEPVPGGSFGYPPPPPPPPSWEQAPEAPTNKSRRRLIAVVGAVVLVGAGVAVGVTVFGSTSKTSQAQTCKNAATGASLVSQTVPNATATVTPGGTPIAGVPSLPAGQSAACTLTITTSGVTVKGYMAVYAHSSKTDGYRALLVQDGFTQTDGSAASATGAGPLLSPDGNTLVIILIAQGKSVVEELSAPPGS